LRKRLSAGLLAAVLLAWSSWGSGREAIPTSNAACLACHGLTAAGGAKLRIDEIHFQRSVHKDLDCTACHAATAGETGKEIPHPLDIPDPNCTAVCRREDQKAEPRFDPLHYPDSVHGRAYPERGVREVARCWDCHGKHNIRSSSDPESFVHRKNISRTCST